MKKYLASMSAYKHHSDGTLDMGPGGGHIAPQSARNWNKVREHRASQGAHIVVSELLGSFGDNELSPECLEGVHTILHAEYGVCIPRRYTSYIAPVACSKLWMQARTCSTEKARDSLYGEYV